MIAYVPGLFENLDGELNIHIVLTPNNDDLIFLIEIIDLLESLNGEFVKTNYI